MWGIHRWQVNSPHKGSVTRRMFLFDDHHHSILVLCINCKLTWGHWQKCLFFQKYWQAKLCWWRKIYIIYLKCCEWNLWGHEADSIADDTLSFFLRQDSICLGTALIIRASFYQDPQCVTNRLHGLNISGFTPWLAKGVRGSIGIYHTFM